MSETNHAVPPSFLCQPYQPGLSTISPMISRSIQATTSSRKPVSRSSTKKVTLFQGNLILDCPVPTRLMEASARKEKEFSMMRYSAVTCDPDQFAANNYTLRSQLMRRETELFIVMTMYNASINVWEKLLFFFCSKSKLFMYAGRRSFVL